MSNVSVKATYGDDFRRFHITTATSWSDLEGQLKSLFRLPAICVRYRDEEGDEVSLSSDEELREALKVVRDTYVLRLILEKSEKTSGDLVRSVKAAQPRKPPNGSGHGYYSQLATSIGSMKRHMAHSADPKPDLQDSGCQKDKKPAVAQECVSTDAIKRAVKEVITKNCCEKTPAWFRTEMDKVGERIIAGVCDRMGAYRQERRQIDPTVFCHVNILCDGCNETIFGIRYKCGNCADYDLCESCEVLGIHNPSHVFIKIPQPVAPGVGRNKHGMLKPLLKYNLYEQRESHEERKRRKREKKAAKAQSLRDEKKEKMKDGKTAEKNKKVEEKMKRRVEKMDQVAEVKECDEKQKKDMKQEGSLYNAAFVEDCNIQDGTYFSPNTEFEKRWIVKNVGTLSWDPDVTLSCLWGTIPYARVSPVSHIQPGEQTILTVHFTAPSEPGEYESHWRLEHSGAGFGHCFWCSVVVDAPSVEENPIGENGSRDLISFDTSEVPASAATEDNSCQMERQASVESFEAITGPYTGDETAAVGFVDEKLIDEISELRVKHDLIDIAGSTCSVDSDTSDGFFIVPMPECFDVSKPLPQDDSETAEQVGQDVPPDLAFSDPIASSQQDAVLEGKSKAIVTSSHEESNGQNELADDPLHHSVHFPPQYEPPANLASLVVEIASAPREEFVVEDAQHEGCVPSAPPAVFPQQYYFPKESKYVPPKSEYVPPSPYVPVPHHWQPRQSTSPIDQLVEMGFGDRKRNAEFLGKHNNDVQAVVQEFLADLDNDWSTKRH